MTIERDNGLEDPNGCTDPFTGETVNRGTPIAVPFGTPMPGGATPPYFDGGHIPTTSIYVCRDGHWEGVVSYREGAIQLQSDVVSITMTEGSEAVMSGSYTYSGQAEVTLSASVGRVEADGNGGWTWQHTPAGASDDTQIVVVTAIADDETAVAAFELRSEPGRPPDGSR